MKENIIGIIKNALAEGYDVLISDEFYSLQRLLNGDWSVIGECGWTASDAEVATMTVVEVKKYEEGIIDIIVESTGF